MMDSSYSPKYALKLKSQGRKSLAEKMRTYRLNNPAIMKNIDLKKRFGITLVQYTEMLYRQKGCCAICFQPESSIDHRTKNVRSLAVDHNHSTGEIRGLLCSRCNTAIGLLNEDKDLFNNAVTYLSK